MRPSNDQSWLMYVAYGLMSFGVALFFAALALFLTRSTPLSFSSRIDTVKFNDFGAFVAGTVGVLWSLSGVILIIASLKEQKRATDGNIRQFRIQQFENTFFQLINVRYDVIRAMRIQLLDEEFGGPQQDKTGKQITLEGLTVFEELARIIKKNFEKQKVAKAVPHGPEYLQMLGAVCEEQFYLYDADLGHYYGSLRNILSFLREFHQQSLEWGISLTPYDEIVAGQLSNYELIVLTYYVLTYPDDPLFELVNYFRILRPLPKIVAMEKRSSFKWSPVILDPDFLIANFDYLSANYAQAVTPAAN